MLTLTTEAISFFFLVICISSDFIPVLFVPFISAKQNHNSWVIWLFLEANYFTVNWLYAGHFESLLCNF